MTSWSRYGESYDVLATHNGEYRGLLDLVSEEFERLALPAGARVAELGGGTGNFTLRLAREHPGKRFLLLDLDPVMLAHAERKRDAQGLTNVEIVRGDMASLPFARGLLDCALYVHSLYTLPTARGEPAVARASLRSAHGALKPGGALLVCDPGREIPVNALARRIFAENRRALGLLRTLGLYAANPQAFVQNRRIAARQRSGEYWTHDQHELAREIAGGGFVPVLQRDGLYFGLDDLVIARKPPAPTGAAPSWPA